MHEQDDTQAPAKRRKSHRTSEHNDTKRQAPQRPASDDKKGWEAYWQALDQPWRTQVEIAPERQEYLAQRSLLPTNIEQGIYPFKDVEPKLSRADVEWLLATHESEGICGPVDCSDERQRAREGLDLRGAHLKGADLSGLPLARIRGGLSLKRWVTYYNEPGEIAAANLQEANLSGANLQEADLSGANLQEANFFLANLQEINLKKANLQGAMLFLANLQHANLLEANLQKAGLAGANLQEADLAEANLQEIHSPRANLQKVNSWDVNLQYANLLEANLQGAKLWRANLQKTQLWGANLQEADLSGANLQEADLVRARLKGAYLGGVTLGNEKQIAPQLVDCQWGDVNLAVIEWSRVKILGDEYVAQQIKDSEGEIKKKQTRLSEYEAAVRAIRQLAVVLRNQGLNEHADHFAYRAQFLQWQVLQRQGLQRLEQIQTDLQKQEREHQGDYEQERLNIPQIFVDFLYWPSCVLSAVEQTPDDVSLKRIPLLILQLVFLFYLLVYTPILSLIILMLHMPFMLIWLLGLIVSVIVRPKQEQIRSFLRTYFHLPTPEEFKHGVSSAIQLFFKTLSDHASSAFSVLIDLLTGYGYKPGRTAFWYLVVILGFATTYYVQAPLVKVGGKDMPLSFIGAFIFSITAFHGRGFFLGGDFGYDNFVTILAAIEAVIGLFIELSFIATFTGRFFRR